ncbi:MAG: DNA polymerase I [Patescibacteria group bacterium]
MKKLVLIDSNALVHRAFHALPPLSSPTGQPTNAVYGFTSLLLKMIGDLKPDYIVATFDLAGPTFRHEEYEQYKAQRVKAPDELYEQIPAVKRILTAMGIPILAKEGFEADDVIGTISAQTQDLPNLQTVIVTGDLDTLQLVHGRTVVVFTLRKGMSDTVMYDEDGVRERYGIAPSQVADLKGLKGDPSDNIPGVKGIGEKTAIILVQKFGDIETLYKELEKPEFAADKKEGISENLRAKLLDQKDMALFSKKLSTIVRDVPVSFDLEAADWHRHLDMPALEQLCKEFGFTSLMKRINTALGATVKATTTQALDLDGARQPALSRAILVSKPEKLPEASEAAVHGVISGGVLQTLYITTDGTAVYALSEPTPQVLAETLTRFKTIIGHDLKPIIKLMPDPALLVGYSLMDTRIASWLANPEQRDYALQRVYYEVAALMLDEDQSTWPIAIWQLRPLLWDHLKSMDMLMVLTDIEMPLVPILASMEQAGIRVDTAHISDLLEMASTEVAKLEAHIYKLAGGEFNINSPAQLGEILFTKLGLKGRVRRTGGGALSTAASELEKLRDEHPIVEQILQYRELNKLKTTYIEPFPSLVAADGRLHTTYNQTGTATGRLSSSDPNLQNIPTRTELGQRFRTAFVAPEGYRLLSLDYSQLELRIVAHIAHDETMIEAFRSGEDIHTRTACEVFGVAPIQVDRDMRRQAKVLNFGIIYGMGVLGFARAAGIGRDAAKRFIDEYFTRFSGVAKYMEHTKAEAFERGYVTTLLGRRRPLPDINNRIPQLAAQAERMAINHPIQGTGADLMKLAMIAIERHLREQGSNCPARMLLQVHDELVFEVEEGAVEETARVLAHIMETTYKLDVPLVADAKAGMNWAEMKPLEHAQPA